MPISPNDENWNLAAIFVGIIHGGGMLCNTVLQLIKHIQKTTINI